MAISFEGGLALPQRCAYDEIVHDMTCGAGLSPSTTILVAVAAWS